ncbi:MAG: glycosyl hydrolase family 18 protein [Bacillota bacterium]|nr:glycosyl hydrolase family 18 protein [Bacillota bacterium]
MPGINVISPTWFHLRDEEGNLTNLADSSYVNWAHGKGYQVWALVSNNFDRDLTAAVLRSSEKRERVIDQLLAFSALYNLDGINVDFENMYPEDRDNLTQFMRELAPLAREQGLVLSIDVTFISGNLYWSLIYDRAALADAADYIIVMAYDEHWGTSPVAGSVASLPWVERGLQRVLREVPADKLILGLPLYTRLWEIEYLEGGAEKVASRAYGMDRIQNILAEEGVQPVFNEESGQNYASFDRGDRHYKVWVEDLISLESRIDLAEKYGLAGVAAWRRGFESEEVWELFSRRLKR